MRCIGKTVVRAAVLTAVVGGVAVAVAGPDSVKAFLHQTRSNVRKVVDSQVSDPVALRAQLQNLEQQYPQKIEEVEGDLAELNGQIGQLERDLAVAKQVVAMAEVDLTQMQNVLVKAEAARTEAVSQGLVQEVRVRFDSGDRAVKLEDAYAKANRLTQLRNAYASRVPDLERDLGYLGQQKERLDSLLSQLKTERAEFQSQLWSLDYQVDAISRNDRMIEIMSKRQATIENHSRYKAGSLDQITSRLADIRAKQESKLEMFAQNSDVKNYESAAKYLLDSEAAAKPNQLRFDKPKALEVGPTVIEIGPDDVKPEPKDDGRVAVR